MNSILKKKIFGDYNGLLIVGIKKRGKTFIYELLKIINNN